MNIEQRDALISALAITIDAAMLNVADLRLEAIIDGRFGLNEMNDCTLIELAEDYGLDVSGLNKKENHD